MTTILSLFEESRKFKAGDVIIHEGANNRDLYILSKGILEISLKDDENRIVVNEITSPEIMGEISFLNGTPRTATVSAKTDVEMFILSYDKVKKELSEIPSWFRLILMAFTNRMRSCDDRLKEYDLTIKQLTAELAEYKKKS